MLAFITSLRHPQNSSDYGRVEALLHDTIKSVTAQTSDDYVVIVVGNKRPELPLPDKTHFVPVDFPAPAPPTGAKTARAPFVWDKGTKIGIGLIAARSFDPDYVMIFDADDFVHRDLAGFVARNPPSAGWVINEGWMYSRGKGAYRRQREFNRTCGTCFILPTDAYEVPTDLSVSATQEEVAAGFGERLPNILGAHRNAVEWHRLHGRVLTPLPFPGAVYHVDTGENHSGKAFVGVGRPLSDTIERDFGIPRVHGRLASLWASVGPVAVLESVWAFATRVRHAVARRANRLLGRSTAA